MKKDKKMLRIVCDFLLVVLIGYSSYYIASVGPKAGQPVALFWSGTLAMASLVLLCMWVLRIFFED